MGDMKIFGKRSISNVTNNNEDDNNCSSSSISSSNNPHPDPLKHIELLLSIEKENPSELNSKQRRILRRMRKRTSIISHEEHVLNFFEKKSISNKVKKKHPKKKEKITENYLLPKECDVKNSVDYTKK